MAYTVIRTDLMSGTDQRADLVSIRFYDSDGNLAAVENGTIVKLDGYEDGEREVMKAVAAKSTDKLEDCAIVAGVELMYDERKKNLDDYTNEAGKAVRAYIPRNHNFFSVTKEGFVGGTVPKKGETVGIGADGKLAAKGTGVGVCAAVEVAGRYTYYVVRIEKPAAAAKA